MLRVTFRLQHDCPFARLSAHHPNVVFAHWCNWRRDVIELRPRTAAEALALRADLKKMDREGLRILSDPQDEKDPRIVALSCPHKPEEDTVDTVIEQHQGLLMPPVIYQAGWERYRFVALDPKQVDPLFQKLRKEGSIEVDRKKPLTRGLWDEGFLLTSDDLLSDLTPKQADALGFAVAQGYYRVPRRARFEDIAARLKVPRTTYEEHVRKAEAKVINALAPYLTLRARSAT